MIYGVQEEKNGELKTALLKVEPRTMVGNKVGLDFGPAPADSSGDENSARFQLGHGFRSVRLVMGPPVPSALCCAWRGLVGREAPVQRRPVFCGPIGSIGGGRGEAVVGDEAGGKAMVWLPLLALLAHYIVLCSSAFCSMACLPPPPGLLTIEAGSSGIYTHGFLDWTGLDWTMDYEQTDGHFYLIKTFCRNIFHRFTMEAAGLFTWAYHLHLVPALFVLFDIWTSVGGSIF
ncbi:uncharacterized protein LOC131197181 [Ahaetulla prasina]|uniref:uncharacterized protein LOC131197181 n=1 Tax=Ahaetulla prasina TaxID=499056 RepID=UPI002649A062|nr:uncharacterized protein LOC131197181 [Ahaetulla prasina]